MFIEIKLGIYLENMSNYFFFVLAHFFGKIL